MCKILNFWFWFISWSWRSIVSVEEFAVLKSVRCGVSEATFNEEALLYEEELESPEVLEVPEEELTLVVVASVPFVWVLVSEPVFSVFLVFWSVSVILIVLMSRGL